MTARLIASCLLLVATAAAQETPTVELNGGMQGQLLSLGRQGYGLTAAVKIANKAQDHVFVLLFGAPSAVDDAGVRFDVMQAINGVAFCRGPAINPPSPRLCVGLPTVDDENLFPLQGYTEIEPGKSATVNTTLASTSMSKGERVSLSAEMAYRLVKEADLAKDCDVPDKQKLKALRFGSISFGPVAVKQKCGGPFFG